MDYALPPEYVDGWVFLEGTSRRMRITDREVFVHGRGWVHMRDLGCGDRVSSHDPRMPDAGKPIAMILTDRAAQRAGLTG